MSDAAFSRGDLVTALVRLAAGDFNGAIGLLLGVPAADLVGRPMAELLADSERPLAEMLLHVGEQGEPQRTLDGATTTPFWYQGVGSVLTTPWSTVTTAKPALDTLSAARVAIPLAGASPRDPIDALIIGQGMTLGKGTTGTGANTVGPGGGLYTSQTQTGLANNGYGAIAGGTLPTDSDNDGMPDSWERATVSNPAVNDAMTKAADGYALIEHYVNWLAVPHAWTIDGRFARIDKATESGETSAISVENTGGTLLSAAPGLYFNAVAALWVFARGQIPFYKNLYGEQDVKPSVAFGIQYQVM